MQRTFGEVLSELARRRCSVDGFHGDAINELALTWLKSGKLNEICPNPNAVMAAVRNKARSLRRAQHYQRRDELAEEAITQPCSTPEDTASARQRLALLKASLSLRHFEVISFDALGYTDSETGTQLGVSADAVRASLTRGAALGTSARNFSSMSAK